MKTVTVELTQRELTLIRVACMERLCPLKEANLAISYEETRSLLNGKLWMAVRAFPGVKEVL
jgi:hypothetical protein